MGSSKIKSKFYLIPEGKNWGTVTVTVRHLGLTGFWSQRACLGSSVSSALLPSARTTVPRQAPHHTSLAPGSQPPAVASIVCRRNRDCPHSKPSTALPGQSSKLLPQSSPQNNMVGFVTAIPHSLVPDSVQFGSPLLKSTTAQGKKGVFHLTATAHQEGRLGQQLKV